MVTILDRQGIQPGTGHARVDTGSAYSTYKEIDTTVPPKARPILSAISVNGVGIAETDILAEAQNHPAGTPGAALIQAARALVVREVLLQAARRAGHGDAVPLPVDGRMETGEDAAIRSLMDAEITVPQANDAECLRHFNAERARFRSEPVWEVRHVLVAAPEGDSDARAEALALARSIALRLQDHPEEFSALAQLHSACPSREQGGNLGQIGPGSTVGPFEACLRAMTAGTITLDPVETRFGYHVIALDREEPGQALPFEIVRDAIAARLEAQAWSRAVKHYVGMLIDAVDITGIAMDGAEGPLSNRS